ncbi:MAG: penicillin acylase family protein [Chloroflexi bacterium]|nr:penicillin acylase family protein [Chloroflexota bacterium]
MSAESRGRVRGGSADARRQLVVTALRSDRSLTTFAAQEGMSPPALRRLIRQELATRLPRTTGALAAAVRGAVEIVRDRHGIPHVFAQSERDAYAGLGFVVAQDRLWQLEYRRRWAYGALAEVLGPAALASDRAARTLRFDRIAEAEHAEHPALTRAILEAYAAGVNAAIVAFGDRLPIEFDVLGIRPAPWRAIDTVTIARASLWQFSGRIENVVIGEAAERLLPPDLATRFLTVEAPEETILPPFPSRREAVSPRTGEVPTPRPSRAAGPVRGRGGAISPSPAHRERDIDAVDSCAAQRPGAEGLPSAWDGDVPPQGSNQWAIGSKRSASGAPLLASDGHVPYYQPSTRYEVHLVGGDLDVIGIADVGMPLVHNGRTRGVAWGLTNNVSSNRDLYAEERNPANADEIREGDGWATLDSRQETIQVRGAGPVHLTVRTGPRGPLVNHLIPSVAPDGDAPLALRWVGLDPRDCITSGLELNRAQTAAEARATHAAWQFSGQNPGFADTQGHIGYQMRGRFPVRGRQVRGYRSPANPDDRWQEPVPFETLPAETDPERGWIGSSNQRPHPHGSDLPLYGSYGDGYRGRRMRAVLDGDGLLAAPMSLADMGAMHNDVYSERAAELKGPLADLLARGAGDSGPEADDLARAATLLRRWNAEFTLGSVAASLFNVFWWRWCERVAAVRFPKHLLGPMAGASGSIARDLLVAGDFGWLDADDVAARSRAQGAGEAHETVVAPRLPRTGPAARPGRAVSVLVRSTMREALGWLRANLGADWRQWTWGRLHPLKLTHALSAGRPIFAALFDIGPKPCPGGNGVLNQNSYAIRDRFWTTGGPHYRFLADLSPAGETWGVNTAGNSGNPASAHYADQFADWLAGRYHPLWMDRADIEANAESTQRLTPSTS